jgi:hypothetical protein
MAWRLRVTLMAVNDDLGDPIAIGRTTDTEAVRVVADTLIAEARENTDCDDPVLRTLTEVEADRMERTIAALMSPEVPRLVPDRGEG